MSNRYSGVLPIALAVSLISSADLISSERNTSAVKELITVNKTVNPETKDKQTKEINRETKNNLNIVDLEITVQNQTEPEQLNMQYSLNEQFLAEQFYKPVTGNYKTFVLGTQPEPKFSYDSDEKKTQPAAVSDSDSEMLTVKEAEELFAESQSAYLVGAAHDVSAAKRRKLDYFAKFEPAYFSLFMAQAWSRDVNFNSY